jgi:multidrug resistance protein MdtO
MGTIAQSLTVSAGRFDWLWELLKQEMAPYHGRVRLVARMVTASTLVMIICMVYKIPEAAYAALFALEISRENLESAAPKARTLITASILAGAYSVLGATFVLGSAFLHFLWVVASLFLVFYVLSALNQYAGASNFGYLIVLIIPLWDSQVSTELKVENTLWAVGAISLGSIITVLLEMAFAAFRRMDSLTEAITERLSGIEQLLTSYADGNPAPAETQSSLERLATVGTSRLRGLLQRSDYEDHRKQQMSALVALVGRLVDLAANLAHLTSRVGDEDRGAIREMAHDIAEIRMALVRRTTPRLTRLRLDAGPSPGIPLLAEIGKTVSLIDEVYAGGEASLRYASPPSRERGGLASLIRGPLSSPEHLKFAARGCLAASLSFITYNALFWPGISTSVTTCVLTATTTIGASHQKQFLRFSGAFIGGFVFGLGAQVFILPHIDSIGAFTVLFAVVATAAAWIATSSTRISYFGVQIAVAFFLINLQEFKFQTSLAVARDRVVGVLLGLLTMWLAFDVLWSSPAGVAMKEAFVSGLRSFAKLAREPLSEDTQTAIERSFDLRDTINAQFDNVRSLADGVLFEFGPSRQQDLALRNCIRQWQPQLRTLFLMRATSLKYRLGLPGFELPEAIRNWQREYDERSAQILEEMADRIDGKPPALGPTRDASWDLAQLAALAPAENESAMARIRTFTTLTRGIDRLTRSIADGFAREFPLAT